MSIKFRCPDCRAKIKVSEQFAGQLGVCPTCRKRTTIPAASDPEFAAESGAKPVSEDAQRKASAVQPAAGVEPQAGVSAQAAEERGHGQEASPAPKDEGVSRAASPKVEVPSAPAFIRFKCPNCEKPTGFPADSANKPATCPLCKVQIMVPDRNDGDSFVIGGLPAGGKVPRSAVARSPVSRVASGVPGPDPVSPAPVVVVPSERPPYGLMALGGAILLVLAVVVGIFIGGIGRSPVPEQQAVAPATPPVVTARSAVEPAEQPEAVKQAVRRSESAAPPAVQEPATPFLPAVTAPVQKPDEPAAPDAAAQPGAPPAAEPGEEKDKKAEVPPPPVDPASLIPDSLPRPKAKSDEDEAPLKPADTATDAVRNILDTPAKSEPPAAPAAPAAPAEPTTIAPVARPPACAKCYGCGYVPLPALRPYVHVHGEKPPEPATVVPWLYCDQCMKGHDNKELLAIEAERFSKSLAKNAVWDKIAAPANIKLIHVETRHVLIHTDLPLATAKQAALMLDKLSTFLQQKTHSCLLVQTRPDTCEQVILGSKASYTAMTYELEKLQPNADWALRRQASAFSMGSISIANAEGPNGPEPMAIHQFSQMALEGGTLNLNGCALNLALGFRPEVNSTYRILSNTGGTLAGTPFAQGRLVSAEYGGKTYFFRVDYASDGITLTALPQGTMIYVR